MLKAVPVAGDNPCLISVSQSGHEYLFQSFDHKARVLVERIPIDCDENPVN